MLERSRTINDSKRPVMTGRSEHPVELRDLSLVLWRASACSYRQVLHGRGQSPILLYVA